MRFWLSLLVIGISLTGPAIAWDGDWTNETTDYSVHPATQDPTSKHGDAGTGERPQKYFIPPSRDFAEVDPGEDGDYRRKDYSPYALARIAQTMRLNGVTLSKGYYLIKPDGPEGGSPNRHLEDPTVLQLPPDASAPVSTSDTGNAEESYRVFVVKKLGNVVAVLPIHRKTDYKPDKSLKINKKKALAWIDFEDQHPVLKFYYRNAIYSTDFEPDW